MGELILESTKDRLCGEVNFILDLYANTISGGTKLFASRAVTLQCPFNLEEYLEKQVDIVMDVWADDYHRSRVQCEISAVTDDWRDYSMRKSEVKSLSSFSTKDISKYWEELSTPNPRYIDF